MADEKKATKTDDKPEPKARLVKRDEDDALPVLEAPPGALLSSEPPPGPVKIVLASRDRDPIGTVDWPGPPASIISYGGHMYSHVAEHEGLWLFAAIN